MIEGTLASVKKGVASSNSMADTFSQLETAVGEIVHLADEMGGS
jgi:hypothetical protein